jgi:hypothetical protein
MNPLHAFSNIEVGVLFGRHPEACFEKLERTLGRQQTGELPARLSSVESV